ncbi:MAG: hypothetical protein WC359_13145 [Dehalococcoidia bacterium]|jgi:hypothetical protein
MLVRLEESDTAQPPRLAGLPAIFRQRRMVVVARVVLDTVLAVVVVAAQVAGVRAVVVVAVVAAATAGKLQRVMARTVATAIAQVEQVLQASRLLRPGVNTAGALRRVCYRAESE